MEDSNVVVTLQMIRDLMKVKKIETDPDVGSLVKPLREMQKWRNAIVHGIWMKRPETKEPVLQITKGEYALPTDQTILAARAPQNLQTSAGHLSPSFSSSSATRFSSVSSLSGASFIRRQRGNLSRMVRTLSSAAISSPPVVKVQALNGTVQLSCSADTTIGLLLERGSLWCGLLLSPDAAEQLAELLAVEARLRRAPRYQSADR